MYGKNVSASLLLMLPLTWRWLLECFQKLRGTSRNYNTSFVSGLDHEALPSQLPEQNRNEKKTVTDFSRQIQSNDLRFRQIFDLAIKKEISAKASK